jgi:alanine racemase
VAVARALAEADGFAVARLEEGLQLRDSAISKRIVVLGGAITASEALEAARAGLDLVIHSTEQISMLEKSPGGPPVDVWLKIDTGMGRLGIAPDETPMALARLKGIAARVRAIRAMSHFASADYPDDPTTREQQDCFAAAIGDWPGDVSLANSAAIIHWPETTRHSAGLRYAGENWVRPGLMLYGVAPAVTEMKTPLHLLPAMSFETRLIAVKRIARGRRVGYGGDWRADRDTRLGIAAAGYGDGYPWQHTEATMVRVGGQPARVVGRISMDLITIDLTDLPDAQVGDRVVLWGDAPSVEDVAGFSGRISYELLCGVSPRVDRRPPAAEVADHGGLKPRGPLSRRKTPS